MSRVQFKYEINQLCVGWKLPDSRSNSGTVLCPTDQRNNIYQIRDRYWWPTLHSQVIHAFILPHFYQVILMLNRIGAAEADYKQFSSFKTRFIHGMKANVRVFCDHTDSETFKEVSRFFMQSMVLSSYCLDANVKKMLKIWLDLFTKFDFVYTVRIWMKMMLF
ncbi:hypothetical protein RF11_09940 [Thelohanellus kitauei]|uniref:Peptidase M16C associated domain-containing protein n=1 Tax=Thelohanellus kitauei TaxID=669202 RepID=A0A0C2IMW3_THEKT|nr:hypothetical protein RF11_09940 [Thelohanellus kitauei]